MRLIDLSINNFNDMLSTPSVDEEYLIMKHFLYATLSAEGKGVGIPRAKQESNI